MVKNVAISAARVVAVAIQSGAPEPKDVKVAIFMFAWQATKAFALIDNESLIAWRYSDGENGPVVIETQHGDHVALMLEQIATAVAASP
jgi:hypothetical protein